MGKIIGIDLGTTNSAVAYMLAGKPEVIVHLVPGWVTVAGFLLLKLLVRVLLHNLANSELPLENLIQETE